MDLLKRLKKNSKPSESTFTKKPFKKRKGLVSFLYELKDSIKSRTLKRLSPILNHPIYGEVKKIIFNLLFTSGIIALVLWLFGVGKPLHKGIGIAVTIGALQYYVEWYYKMRKKYGVK